MLETRKNEKRRRELVMDVVGTGTRDGEAERYCRCEASVDLERL